MQELMGAFLYYICICKYVFAARTLGSWVRIPLKAWMSVYSAFVFGSGLATV
jgi:hypothetical protein